MTEERPRPQYGEYATPEQQAAAMGKAFTPPPAPETRVAIPVVPGTGRVSSSPDQREPRNPPQQLQLGGNAIDRFATVFQLGIGLVYLINSNYFQLAETLNPALSEAGAGITVPVTIDRLGWLILTVNIVLLLASAAVSFLRLRRAKIAFFVPLIGFAAFSLFLSFVLIGVLRG